MNTPFLPLACLLLLSLIGFVLSCSEGTGSDHPASEGETATFAGGCFWCMEHPFEELDGVLAVISGYTGGQTDHPTYRDVADGGTGHMEAVQITYDTAKISYSELLDVFWRQVDPTDPDGQFIDRGAPYRTAIFYHNEKQRETAEKSKETLQRSGLYDKPIVTEIVRASTFYPAEDYHQDFYKKNPERYENYRSSSGRDPYLQTIWGDQGKRGNATVHRYRKPGRGELTGQLTPLQFRVTQEEGTEKAFDNAYWNHKKEGIYVDVVSGEPLFSSLDKYDSGTGWPSFSRPLEPANIVTREDRKFFSKRIEVRSKHADSHLGHVFPDGPEPTGLRYCINSAALRFIPKEDLGKEGYGQYKDLFPDSSP